MQKGSQKFKTAMPVQLGCLCANKQQRKKPLRNLPSCSSLASRPLSPRSPGAVGAGVKATCPAEGPRATARASTAMLLPCGHDCPSRGTWHPWGATHKGSRACPAALPRCEPPRATYFSYFSLFYFYAKRKCLPAKKMSCSSSGQFHQRNLH